MLFLTDQFQVFLNRNLYDHGGEREPDQKADLDLCERLKSEIVWFLTRSRMMLILLICARCSKEQSLNAYHSPASYPSKSLLRNAIATHSLRKQQTLQTLQASLNGEDPLHRKPCTPDTLRTPVAIFYFSGSKYLYKELTCISHTQF